MPKKLIVPRILVPKPYLCEIHGERYTDLMVTKDAYLPPDVFCGECLRLKFLELGLKPMQRIAHKTTIQRLT